MKISPKNSFQNNKHGFKKKYYVLFTVGVFFKKSIFIPKIFSIYQY